MTDADHVWRRLCEVEAKIDKLIGMAESLEAQHVELGSALARILSIKKRTAKRKLGFQLDAVGGGMLPQSGEGE